MAVDVDHVASLRGRDRADGFVWWQAKLRAKANWRVQRADDGFKAESHTRIRVSDPRHR